MVCKSLTKTLRLLVRQWRGDAVRCAVVTQFLSLISSGRVFVHRNSLLDEADHPFDDTYNHLYQKPL